MSEENKSEEENVEPSATGSVEPDFVDSDIGKLADRDIQTEMQESYLDYAMSVIVARALPDVRDGLKPVHRRVLYAMWDTGLKSSSKYRKCAAVVGEVMKSYHPHGDLAIYDTLVRMAQDFSMRYLLVDGQGNFGSMDGDRAAAMRYTESRMSKIAEEMLSDIEKDTVEFSDNYDGSTKEPNVLPSRVPQLLLNGAMGIAVGMATNIPPHNLTEICDGLIHLIDNPSATSEDLTNFIPGPDFPTGGMIFNREEIKEAYISGKGSIIMRGKAEIEEVKRGFRIIITEIPYQVNKSILIQKIAELVKGKKIDGISDIRDESDREGIRVVIELKSSSYPKKVLNRLFELTPLQSSFHVNMLALTPTLEPRVMNLRTVLEFYLKHREEVILRRTKFDLERAKERAHILEGLRIALTQIDKIIETIKKSENREQAAKNLVFKFGLSMVQANAILEMRLATLAALERQKIEDEYQEKLKLIAYLKEILADPKKILALIKNDLIEIKEKYGDKRRTKIVASGLDKFSAEDLIPDERVIITLTRSNYVKRQPTDTYRKQIRGGKGVAGITTKEEDSIAHMLTASTHDDLYIFTDSGRIFSNKVYELPATSRQSKGVPIVNIIQLAQSERVTAVLPLGKDENAAGKYFVMMTTGGIVKRTEISKYQHIRKTGIAAIKLKSGDQLKWVQISSGNDVIVEVSGRGLSVCYKERDVRPMGRSAAGVIGMKLRPGDAVVGSIVIPAGEKYFLTTTGFPDLLVVLENGFGKRTMIKNFHLQNRGGIGIKTANCTSRTGNLVGMEVIYDDLGDAVLASKNGQFIRMTIKSIKRLGRDTQGVTLMKLRAGDKVSSLTVVRPEEKTETVNNESKIINQGKEKESKTKAVKPKIPDSEFRIQNSEKPKEKPKKVKPAVNVRKKKAIRDSYPPIVETSKIEKKKSDNKSHHSLLEKPDDVMPTIRAYDPKVDLEIKKTLKDDSLEKKRFDDVNWWGRQ